MHDADDQRAKNVKETEARNGSAQPTWRTEAFALMVLDSGVGVPVKVQIMIVLVDVCMRAGYARMGGRELFAQPPHGSGEIENTKENKHQADGEFHSQAGTGRNDETEEDDGTAHDGDGQSVAATPKDAD